MVQITLEVVLKALSFSFALQCQLQMKERITVLVENRYVILLFFIARLREPTRLIQLKGEFFFSSSKNYTIIHYTIIHSDAFLSDIICYFSVFMMRKRELF